MMKCNTCANVRYCYDGNHQLTRDECADNGFWAYAAMSNYDRFISKAPEEIAILIGKGCPPARVKYCQEYLTAEGYTNCTDCWLDWLKSPVEEGEG